MIVVLLAGTVAEAVQYAKDAGLARKNTITAGSPQVLEGLRLADEDLIVQFPTFMARRDSSDIIDVLLQGITLGGTKPRWERVGKT